MCSLWLGIILLTEDIVEDGYMELQASNMPASLLSNSISNLDNRKLIKDTHTL